MAQTPFICTYTGKTICLTDPDPEDICLEDIAHGLANLCRFNGQCSRFYSVAHHTMLVSVLVAPTFAPEALLHDAAEAYLGDMTRPLKALPDMHQFRQIEEMMRRTIAKAITGNPDFHFGYSALAAADNAALWVEAKTLGMHPENWPTYELPMVPDLFPIAERWIAYGQYISREVIENALLTAMEKVFL